MCSFKGNGYSVSGETFGYKIIDGIYMFKAHAVYKDVDLKGLASYAADDLVIIKITKGSLFFLTEDGKEVRLNSGDICNAAGNFKMAKTHSFNQEVGYVSIMYWHISFL